MEEGRRRRKKKKVICLLPHSRIDGRISLPSLSSAVGITSGSVPTSTFPKLRHPLRSRWSRSDEEGEGESAATNGGDSNPIPNPKHSLISSL
ncbi:hypothetical protein LINPERHAP1_LOCUS2711, partial [Linum perenne]